MSNFGCTTVDILVTYCTLQELTHERARDQRSTDVVL